MRVVIALLLGSIAVYAGSFVVDILSAAVSGAYPSPSFPA